MVMEFEGKTEQEAIENAASELGLDREKFDVEILENEKKGFFKKGNVRIRIHLRDSYNRKVEAVTENEKKIIEFLQELIDKMGFQAIVKIKTKEENKLTLNIESESSAILIGKHGKNLDALQLLVNVFSGKHIGTDEKIILDTEDYRARREENIIRFAKRTAEQVKRTKRSKLLEPMNPFERRLIHTALGTIYGITTKSEGDGLYKQVRILYSKGNPRNIDDENDNQENQENQESQTVE